VACMESILALHRLCTVSGGLGLRGANAACRCRHTVAMRSRLVVPGSPKGMPAMATMV
jgi:hypothetical protein